MIGSLNVKELQTNLKFSLKLIASNGEHASSPQGHQQILSRKSNVHIIFSFPNARGIL